MLDPLGLLTAVLVVVATPATAQELTPAERAQIDSGVTAVLAATGAPSRCAVA
jgi:hypothetical protein